LYWRGSMWIRFTPIIFQRLCCWTGQGRRIETEAAPIRYVAELVGAHADSERAIRALMVMCCDPLAIALTAAASARK
jgi:hypothetical protein